MTGIAESRVADQIEPIRAACVEVDGIDPLDEATNLRLRSHGLATDDQLWVHGRDGFLLALATDGGRHRELTLAVRPGARGQGIAGDLLRAEATPENADADYSAWSHGDHPAAAALARSTGFRHTRALWVMRRGVEPTPSDQTRRTNSDVTIRAYQPGDAEALVAINAAAFADHPEQGAMDADNLAERMASAWFDPNGLLIAVDAGGTMLGFHWTKLDPETIATTGRLVGEVYVVAVSPAAHGQGVGRQLMDAGLDHLARQGSEQIVLYVEATNTPALALYESLGFTHEDRDTHVLYHRPAKAPVDP